MLCINQFHLPLHSGEYECILFYQVGELKDSEGPESLLIHKQFYWMLLILSKCVPVLYVLKKEQIQLHDYQNMNNTVVVKDSGPIWILWDKCTRWTDMFIFSAHLYKEDIIYFLQMFLYFFQPNQEVDMGHWSLHEVQPGRPETGGLVSKILSNCDQFRKSTASKCSVSLGFLS